MAALGLLKNATRVSAKKDEGKHLITDPALVEVAAKVAQAVAVAKETATEAEALKDDLKAQVEPIQTALERTGGTTCTCAIGLPDEHEVQVQFKQYGAVDAVIVGTKTKPDVDNEAVLKSALGRQYNSLIQRKRTIAVAPSVANSDERLSEMLKKLEEAFGKDAAEAFVGEYLTVREQLVPAADFSVRRFELEESARETVESMFKRTVAVMVR